MEPINNLPKIKLFNTATRQKDLLRPIQTGQVNMYTCGPTVYDFAHIGNFRTYIFEDLLRRTLKFFNYNVFQVMNLTDIDDKTIKGAISNGFSLDEYTDKYKKAFFEDMNLLKIEPAEAYPPATEYVDDMIEMIQQLLDKGFAYKSSDNSIYYHIEKFPNYGRLSHLNMKDLKVNAAQRITTDEYDKEHLSDFVLWKSYNEERDGGVYWDSPFGPGRPGWHIECSTMAMKLLGDTIDIHVGGVDNIFPHHENEIAQSEACSGKTFANIWMHSEHLLVNGKKMSKSLGNFYTLRTLLEKGYSGNQVRYMLIQTHYKTQLNFTIKGLEAAGHALDRINNFIERIASINTSKQEFQVDELIATTMKTFQEALADDLNIASALAALFDFIRDINGLCDQNKIGKEQAQSILDTLKQVDTVLNVMNFKTKKDALPEAIQQAIIARDQARKEKNWAKSDELRDFIVSQGYLLEDTPNGSVVKPKS